MLKLATGSTVQSINVDIDGPMINETASWCTHYAVVIGLMGTSCDIAMICTVPGTGQRDLSLDYWYGSECCQFVFDSLDHEYDSVKYVL